MLCCPNILHCISGICTISCLVNQLVHETADGANATEGQALVVYIYSKGAGS